MAVMPQADLLESSRPGHSVPASVTPSHPQLRDLLVCTPEQETVCVVTWDSIASLDLYDINSPEYTKLRFPPSTISYGCGLICAGGQGAELALKSADRNSKWLYQLTSETSGSINNSIDISPSPLCASRPRLLVSNNDESIKVYEVAQGSRPPDWVRAKRRRKRERVLGGYEDADPTDVVEEEGVWDMGTECKLERLAHAEIKLHTAINHTSVSPDGKRMVAVGDTAEIFCFDVRSDGQYEMTGVFEGSRDAAFSTDWSHNSLNFAVGSQDGYVHVYDVRMQAERGSNDPRRVTSIRTTQRGPAGAVRKVKFSPGRVAPELVAFTEHRRVVHVVDARTYETVQIVKVPIEETPPPPRQLSTCLKPPRLFKGSNRTIADVAGPAVQVGYSMRDGLETVLGADEARNYIARLLDGASASPSASSSSSLRAASRSRAWDSTYELVPQEPPADDITAPNAFGLDEDCPTDPLPRRLDRRTMTRTTLNVGSERFVPSGDINGWTVVRPNLSGGATHTFYSNSSLPGQQQRLGPGFYHAAASSSSGAATGGSASLYGLGGLRGVPGVGPGTSTGYHSTSSNFPVENCADDLLGLDWDEWGETLFVATAGRVWEWRVNSRGRRCFGTASMA